MSGLFVLLAAPWIGPLGSVLYRRGKLDIAIGIAMALLWDSGVIVGVLFAGQGLL